MVVNGGQPVATMASEKRILNCSVTDPNRILPMKYGWARDYYKIGVANTWTPEEVSMQTDVEMWKNPIALTKDERHMILRNLGFFSTGESLTANNVILAIYKHITNPECRQYLLRQAFEEAIHTDTFIYICDTLSLDPDHIYTMYLRIPSIKEKDDFVVGLTKSILDPQFTTMSTANIQEFIYDLVGYYSIMEGIFFYAGFVMMLSLLRQNKMVGIGGQFQFILRDESVHVGFGSELIRTIVAENPIAWTEGFKKKVTENIERAVELEYEYAKDCLPKGLLGLSAEKVREYLQYIADRRLGQIGLNKVYRSRNPFNWMSEMIDLRKERNIFETRVVEYKHGSTLQWDR